MYFIYFTAAGGSSNNVPEKRVMLWACHGMGGMEQHWLYANFRFRYANPKPKPPYLYRPVARHVGANAKITRALLI